jgi:hypothetical protein
MNLLLNKPPGDFCAINSFIRKKQKNGAKRSDHGLPGNGRNL